MSDPPGDNHGGGWSRPSAASAAAGFTTTTTDGGEQKCTYRSCRIRSGGDGTIPCRRPGCDKMVHRACYQTYLLEKHALQPLPGDYVVCTKKCYEKVAKELSFGGYDNAVVEGRRGGGWNNDEKGENGRSSMKILLDWWTTEDNYARFRSNNKQDGITKREHCASLAEIMTQETLSKRDAKNVMNKIQHVEKKWNEAHNFATSETGAELQARDGGASIFEEVVKKKCPYYYDLLEIMGDRTRRGDETMVGDSTIRGDQNMGDSTGGDDDANSSNNKRMRRSNSGSTSFTTKNKNTMVLTNEISELNRHHKAMERLEEKKLKTLSWKGKNDELEYKMNLLRKYQEIKTNFGWSDAKISQLFPDMQQVMEMHGDDDDDDDSSEDS
eukprot:scaffold8212_cov93-Cylindrotheca_fusiformis.AAC.3